MYKKVIEKATFLFYWTVLLNILAINFQLLYYFYWRWVDIKDLMQASNHQSNKKITIDLVVIFQYKCQKPLTVALGTRCTWQTFSQAQITPTGEEIRKIFQKYLRILREEANPTKASIFLEQPRTIKMLQRLDIHRYFHLYQMRLLMIERQSF